VTEAKPAELREHTVPTPGAASAISVRIGAGAETMLPAGFTAVIANRRSGDGTRKGVSSARVICCCPPTAPNSRPMTMAAPVTSRVMLEIPTRRVVHPDASRKPDSAHRVS
jgi:hypothetical protein